MTDMERMLGKIAFEPMSGCWLFLGSLDRDGYGQFQIGSRSDGSRKNTRAHSFMYKALVGAIPEGKYLDHKCRVRCCANPHHLEPVTMRENTLRGISPAAVNAKKTHCNRGHELTPENTYSRGQYGFRTRQCKECQRLLRKAG